MQPKRWRWTHAGRFKESNDADHKARRAADNSGRRCSNWSDCCSQCGYPVVKEAR